ncbi:hypothetical protein C0416_05240 [bacterium]|nr:hypothetical protein [bacterium]
MRVPRSSERVETGNPKKGTKSNKEVALIKNRKEEVGKAVSSVTDNEPAKNLSFKDAAEVLKLETGFDLEAAREDAVKTHGRWGLIEALIEKGAIKNESEYSELLGEATISEKGLKGACDLIKVKARMLTAFDPGIMTPDELFEAIFTVKQIGDPDLALYYTDTYAFKNLANIRKIHPENLPDLTKLMKMPDEGQVDAFKEAYNNGEPLKPTGPRLFFTHDCQNVTYTKTSAVEDMRSSVRGDMKFLDPMAGFLAARLRIDAGMKSILKLEGRGAEYARMSENFYRSLLVKFLKNRMIIDHMSDNKNTVRYPGYAFEDGYMPALNFHSNSRMFYAGESSPSVSDKKVGSRIMYG